MLPCLDKGTLRACDVMLTLVGLHYHYEVLEMMPPPKQT